MKILLSIALVFVLVNISQSANVDISLLQQDDVKTINFGLLHDFKYKRTEHLLKWSYYKVSDSPSRNDVLLSSKLPLQDIDFRGKYEYYKEQIRRNRIGFGVGKEFKIFFIDQLITQELIHEGDDDLLLDTIVGLRWKYEEADFMVRYSFLTNLDEKDYKYIFARVNYSLSKYIYLALEIDRRWELEEDRKDITKFLIGFKI